MRWPVLGCLALLSCAKAPGPAQDPLDYLQVGVDPREEAATLVDDLRRSGFQVGRRIDEKGYVAFDASSNGESTVRVVSGRGVVLSVQAPDVRWPERLWVELAPDPRPDFDRDGQRDVVVAARERDRTCLAWAQVDGAGFASEVFRPQTEWGERPCVIEIDPAWPRLVLEVDVPGAEEIGARARLPVYARDRRWGLDHSSSGSELWETQITRRKEALEVSKMNGDTASAARLRAELEWIDQLRNAEAPVLEPAKDGEEAR